MCLSHLGIQVNDYDMMTGFYQTVLAPLGFWKMVEPVPGVVQGIGSYTTGPTFWISKAKENTENPTTHPAHIAFAANSRPKVRAFYEAAIKAGAKCNGKPGVRKQYMKTYYGTFVIDPEGRNIEAVCLMPGFWAERSWTQVVLGGLAVVGGVAAWVMQAQEGLIWTKLQK